MDYHEIDPTFEDDLKQQPISQAEWVPPWECGSDPAEMLKWLKPATRAFDSASVIIERDLFADLPALRKMARPVVEPEPVERIFAVPQAGNALAKLAGRLNKVWNSKKHRDAVTAMLKPLLATMKFKSSPTTDEALEQLTSSMVDHCCQSVFEAAEESTL